MDWTSEVDSYEGLAKYLLYTKFTMAGSQPVREGCVGIIGDMDISDRFSERFKRQVIDLLEGKETAEGGGKVKIVVAQAMTPSGYVYLVTDRQGKNTMLSVEDLEKVLRAANRLDEYSHSIEIE